MALNTRYMGMELRNPIIVGSSPLTSSLDSLKKCEDAGAGAVVIKSLFEESVLAAIRTADVLGTGSPHVEAGPAIAATMGERHVDAYLTLVSKARESLEIPVIASINCTSTQGWLSYAQRFVQAGASALELNQYIVASDSSLSSAYIEQMYIKTAQEVRSAFKIPVAMKLGYAFTSPGNLFEKLGASGVDALVLFNRFFRQDIDIDALEPLTPPPAGPGHDYLDALRWTALLSGRIPCDICASTGIMDGRTVIKQLLAGAKAVQVVSALMVNGIETLTLMLQALSQWMEEHDFESLDAFRGMFAYKPTIENIMTWERAQYISAVGNEFHK